MNSCQECKGECCRYVAVKLGEPKDSADWDEIKWLIIHEGVMVYKDNEDEWMVEFRTKCKHLDDSTNKCTNYEHRPEICKGHDPQDCDASPGEFSKVLFEKPKDVDEYLINSKNTTTRHP